MACSSLDVKSSKHSRLARWHGCVPFLAYFSVPVCKGTCQDFWFIKELRVDDSEECLRQNIMSNAKYYIID